MMGCLACYVMLSGPPRKVVPSADLFPPSIHVLEDVWIIIPAGIAFLLILRSLIQSDYMEPAGASTWKPGKRKPLPHEEYEEDLRQKHKSE
jgi:hypothetical protein